MGLGLGLGFGLGLDVDKCVHVVRPTATAGVVGGGLASWSGYLRLVGDCPEDDLVEFASTDKGGRTFVLQRTTELDEQRRAWRAGARSIKRAPAMPLEDVEAALRMPLAEHRGIPLESLLQYLAHWWPREDGDYPPAERLLAMGLEEMFLGPDWRWED